MTPSELAAYMKRRGLVQNDMAEIMHVGIVTIQDWLAGRKRPSYCNQRILDALLAADERAMARAPMEDGPDGTVEYLDRRIERLEAQCWRLHEKTGVVL